jgi:general stress protein 26
MNEIEGMKENFGKARVVYMTTFRDGEEHSRQMTNFNEDPYGMIWFPTDRDTRKVEDIKENPRVLITFPSSKEGFYYEMEGRAEFESEEVTRGKWEWWYLYWRPTQKRRFWFPREGQHPERVIINIHTVRARMVSKDDV